MGTELKTPTLEGTAPETTRTRAVMILLGLAAAAILAIAGYRAVLVQYQEKKARDSLRRGADFLAQGYFEDAKFELETAVGMGPPSRRAYLLLAKADAALGDLQAAVSDYRRAVEISPADPENHFLLALALSARGRRDEAVEEAQEALGRKPDYAAARLLAARLLEQEYRFKEAADHYKELAKFTISKKQLAGIHVALAKLYIKEKRRAAAAGLLQSARAMDNKNEEARRLLVSLEKGKGRRDAVAAGASTTDTISSRITQPARLEAVGDDVVAISGTAKARSGAVVQVEVTFDGGLTWHMAKPVNGAFNRWWARVRFPESDGVRYVLQSRAIGSAGVPERLRPGTPIVVDNTGPFVIRQISPPRPSEPGGWYLTPPTINMAVLEGDSLLFYKWGNGDYRVYTSALKAPAGVNTLSYFTRDRQGNEGRVEKMTVKVKVAGAAG